MTPNSENTVIVGNVQKIILTSNTLFPFMNMIKDHGNTIITTTITRKLSVTYEFILFGTNTSKCSDGIHCTTCTDIRPSMLMETRDNSLPSFDT